MTRRGAIYKVKIRRDLGLPVRPEAEQIDGKSYTFIFGWCMEDELDPTTHYASEDAMIPNDPEYPEDAPDWIASGDLEDESGEPYGYLRVV